MSLKDEPASEPQVYEGEFEGDALQGSGCMDYPSGARYVGEWEGKGEAWLEAR